MYVHCCSSSGPTGSGTHERISSVFARAVQDAGEGTSPERLSGPAAGCLRQERGLRDMQVEQQRSNRDSNPYRSNAFFRVGYFLNMMPLVTCFFLRARLCRTEQTELLEESRNGEERLLYYQYGMIRVLFFAIFCSVC